MGVKISFQTRQSAPLSLLVRNLPACAFKNDQLLNTKFTYSLKGALWYGVNFLYSHHRIFVFTPILNQRQSSSIEIMSSGLNLFNFFIRAPCSNYNVKLANFLNIQKPYWSYIYATYVSHLRHVCVTCTPCHQVKAIFKLKKTS